MRTLDTLIEKFKEVKEELAKNGPLHDNVPGFMAGLKSIPKEDAAGRGKFITAHMNHGPFISALQAHPQGQQMHSQLTGFLNSAQNAGFKPGATKTTVAPAPVQEQDFRSMVTAPRSSSVVTNNDPSTEAFRYSAPQAPAPKIQMPTPEEHAQRASMYDDFMPAGNFGKSEIALNKGGQWMLKGEYDYRGEGAKEEPKDTGIKGALKRFGNKVMEAGVKALDPSKNTNSFAHAEKRLKEIKEDK